MTCESTKRKLGRFYDKELRQTEVDEVSRHLMSCADCRAELAQLDRIGELLHGVQLAPVPKDFVKNVVAKASQQNAVATKTQPDWHRLATSGVSSWLAITSAVLIGLTIGLGMALQLRVNDAVGSGNSTGSMETTVVRPYGLTRSPESIESTLAYDYYSLFTAVR